MKKLLNKFFLIYYNTKIKLMENYVKNLINTLETIENDKRIKEIVDILSVKITKTGRIVIVAAGANKLIIENLIDSFSYLFKIKKDKFIFLSLENAFEEMTDNWKEFENNKSIGALSCVENKINKNDVIFGLSSTGRTDYINYFLKQAKELNATTILISSSMKSEPKDYINYNMIFPLKKKEIYGLYIGNHTTIIKVICEKIFFSVFENIGQIVDGRILTTKMWTQKLLNVSMNTIEIYNNSSFSQEELKILIKEAECELSVVIVMLNKKVSSKIALNILQKENYNFKNIL